MCSSARMGPATAAAPACTADDDAMAKCEDADSDCFHLEQPCMTLTRDPDNSTVGRAGELLAPVSCGMSCAHKISRVSMHWQNHHYCTKAFSCSQVTSRSLEHAPALTRPSYQSCSYIAFLEAQDQSLSSFHAVTIAQHLCNGMDPWQFCFW